jgi:hypothetical protein
MSTYTQNTSDSEMLCTYPILKSSLKEIVSFYGLVYLQSWNNDMKSITCDGELVLLKENWESVSSVSGRSESKHDDARPLL